MVEQAMKPHEIAQLIHLESQKFFPSQCQIEDLMERLSDLVGLAWAIEMVRHAATPRPTIH